MNLKTPNSNGLEPSVSKKGTTALVVDPFLAPTRQLSSTFDGIKTRVPIIVTSEVLAVGRRYRWLHYGWRFRNLGFPPPPAPPES